IAARGPSAVIDDRALPLQRIDAVHAARYLHDRHPAVGPLPDPRQTRRGERTQIDRRTRSLHRLELDPREGYRPPLATVLDRTGGPQRFQRIQQFVELRAPAPIRCARRLELLRRPADAESRKQPTAA